MIPVPMSLPETLLSVPRYEWNLARSFILPRDMLACCSVGTLIKSWSKKSFSFGISGLFTKLQTPRLTSVLVPITSQTSLSSLDHNSRCQTPPLRQSLCRVQQTNKITSNNPINEYRCSDNYRCIFGSSPVIKTSPYFYIKLVSFRIVCQSPN